VLPVLACSKIVMSAEPRARLGRVAAGGKTLPRSERAAYEDGEVVAAHGAPVLVRKTYDPAVSVVEIKPPPQSGPRYLDAADKPRPKGEPVADLGPGETAFYSFAQARDFGICEQAPCNDVDAVLALCDLPRSSLARPLDRVSAWRLVVAGTVNGELKEKVQRRVKRALGHRDRPNLLVLQLECGDGESQTAHELALFLAGLNEGRPDNPVQTVAFVTPQARNTAAFLAFACNKIVMQREAKLGDFDAYMKDRPTLEATVRKNLSEVAGKQHYPVLLADGMLSRELRIHRVESVKGENARTFLSDDDFRADQGQGGEHRWRSLGLVKPQAEADENKYLTLTAERARELGVAQEVVPSFEKLCELEGVNPADVHTADSDWLDSLADFLRDPWTSVVLVMLGITCLILELKMPGVSLPGVVAAVCFVLFFWSHSQLNGQITWLAMLLFILGLLLIGLEVFVLPGFGVAGISGILLVLGSLGLVAYGHWPRSNEEWVGFGQKIGPFGISILGALALAFILARYLPSIPYANRLMLRPQDELAAEAGDVPPDSVQPDLANLLGAIGVAATPLRPAGKTQFGDEFVDVVAEGGYVLPGTRVQVIEIEGNRVVVKEV
jgi:membrane-bound ClpP family serine protease